MTYNFNYAQFWPRKVHYLKKSQVRFKWHIFEHTKEKQIKAQDPDKSLLPTDNVASLFRY